MGQNLPPETGFVRKALIKILPPLLLLSLIGTFVSILTKFPLLLEAIVGTILTGIATIVTILTIPDIETGLRPYNYTMYYIWRHVFLPFFHFLHALGKWIHTSRLASTIKSVIIVVLLGVILFSLIVRQISPPRSAKTYSCPKLPCVVPMKGQSIGISDGSDGFPKWHPMQ